MHFSQNGMPIMRQHILSFPDDVQAIRQAQQVGLFVLIIVCHIVFYIIIFMRIICVSRCMCRVFAGQTCTVLA